MIVLLVGPGIGFPHGLASTSRVTALARGLAAHGATVRVLLLGPSEFPRVAVLNTEPRGVRDGVAFEYPGGHTVRGADPPRQALRVLKGLACGFRRVLEMHRREEPVEALLVYSQKWAVYPLFWLAARLCRAAYVIEQCEEPFHRKAIERLDRRERDAAAPGPSRRGLAWRAEEALVTRLYRLFDGAVVISGYLDRYMAARMRRGAPRLRVPILVDTDQFGCRAGPPPVAGRYVAFCGTLNEVKDGVLTLLGAFADIAPEFPAVDLVLIGDAHGASLVPERRAYAARLGIAERVRFTGALPREQMPLWLDPAAVLALARPATPQSEAGFPTKLGEYLATGNPVVVTRTGELDAWLEDGVDVYFAPPGDRAAFAARLRHVLAHPEEAAAVGRRGRETALASFDYRANGARLLGFIRGLRPGAAPAPARGGRGSAGPASG